jgi:phosphoribosylformylglycinamidine cyclo-ligase
MANITGGGFYENIPRMFKGGVDAIIKEGSWTIPPLFARIAAGCNDVNCRGAEAQKIGAELIATNAVLKKQMFNTFNMGIGFVLALAPENVQQAIEHLDGMGFPAWKIGCVEQGTGTVRFV